MKYNPYSLADRLKKADILTNEAIMHALLPRKQGDVIRAMSHDEFKQMRKDVFSGFYHRLAVEAEKDFERACKNYVPALDGIENDPRKNFWPKTVFEINQELKAYFEEQGTLH